MKVLFWLALACKDAPGDTAPPPICGGERAEPPRLPQDDTLRFNQVQALGTHNSYHLEPDTVVDASHAYTLSPLDIQAGEQGVRQFELDIHRRNEGGFDVLHLPVLDEETSCLALEDCLCALRTWSDRNPGHLPLLIWIEPKDDVDELAPEYEPLEGHMLELDAVLRAVFPPQLILEPDELRRGYATLPEAIAAEGWPTLGELRGQVIFALLDTGAARDEYVGDQENLEGRAIFVDNEDFGAPSAALFKIDDAVGEVERIRAALEAGFVVTSNVDSPSDSDEQNAAQFEGSLASGAQFLSTNYPAPVTDRAYWAAIPGGNPARCNPITAPETCASTDLEDLP